MVKTGRPTAVVVLSKAERDALEPWPWRPKRTQVLALRCQVSLHGVPENVGGALASSPV